MPSGTNTNSPVKALNDVITVFTNEDWKCTPMPYVVFMSFTSGVLNGKLINTIKGITGDVAPLNWSPQVPSPRGMVPLLNSSQKQRATNLYFRATVLLWGRRNLGRQGKEVPSPTTGKRFFLALLI